MPTDKAVKRHHAWSQGNGNHLFLFHTNWILEKLPRLVYFKDPLVIAGAVGRAFEKYSSTIPGSTQQKACLEGWEWVLGEPTPWYAVESSLLLNSFFIRGNKKLPPNRRAHKQWISLLVKLRRNGKWRQDWYLLHKRMCYNTFALWAVTLLRRGEGDKEMKRRERDQETATPSFSDCYMLEVCPLLGAAAAVFITPLTILLGFISLKHYQPFISIDSLFKIHRSMIYLHYISVQ